MKYALGQAFCVIMYYNYAIGTLGELGGGGGGGGEVEE